jgi:hypothetical protein
MSNFNIGVGYIGARGNKCSRVIRERTTPAGDKHYSIEDASCTENGATLLDVIGELDPDVIWALRNINAQNIGDDWSFQQALQHCREVARGVLGMGPRVQHG